MTDIDPVRSEVDATSLLIGGRIGHSRVMLTT
jgi:hypothetical protein